MLCKCRCSLACVTSVPLMRGCCFRALGRSPGLEWGRWRDVSACWIWPRSSCGGPAVWCLWVWPICWPCSLWQMGFPATHMWDVFQATTQAFIVAQLLAVSWFFPQTWMLHTIDFLAHNVHSLALRPARQRCKAKPWPGSSTTQGRNRADGGWGHINVTQLWRCTRGMDDVFKCKF